MKSQKIAHSQFFQYRFKKSTIDRLLATVDDYIFVCSYRYGDKVETHVFARGKMIIRIKYCRFSVVKVDFSDKNVKKWAIKTIFSNRLRG